MRASNIRFRAYVSMIINGGEKLRPQKEYAEQLGVDERTIRRWNTHDVDWDLVKTERRKRYSARMIPVDDAMFAQAVKGDVQAAKYLAERFDGWVPTTAQVAIKDADSELLAEAARIKEQLKSAGGEARPDQPGAGPAATA